MSENINKARENTLSHIERNERNYKLAFVSAALIEAIFIGAFVLLADFSNRVHLLLFIAAFAVYTILICGLFALGLHVSRCTLRVLKAIEFSKTDE